jgi:hypothetical protein
MSDFHLFRFHFSIYSVWSFDNVSSYVCELDT